MIPASLLNPIGVAVLNAFPLPNLNAAPQIGSNNWYVDSNYFVGQREVAGRADQYWTDRSRMFARYSRLTRDQYPNVLFPGINSVNGSGANLDTYLQWRTSVTLNETYTFWPSLQSVLSAMALRAARITIVTAAMDSTPASSIYPRSSPRIRPFQAIRSSISAKMFRISGVAST